MVANYDWRPLLVIRGQEAISFAEKNPGVKIKYLDHKYGLTTDKISSDILSLEAAKKIIKDEPEKVGVECYVAKPSTKPKVKIVGVNGNAYNLLGICQKEACRAGWHSDQIDIFRSIATQGDYDDLLRAITTYFQVS